MHAGNILIGNGAYWFFDWGDANITHPFCSLLVICSMLVDDFASSDGQRRIARLRDAYLEPWGTGLADVFALALRVGSFAHTFAWARQRDHLPEEARREFDSVFSIVLRRAVAKTLD